MVTAQVAVFLLVTVSSGVTGLGERLTRVSVNQCCVITYPGLVQGEARTGLMYSHDSLSWSAKMVAQGIVRPAGFQR